MDIECLATTDKKSYTGFFGYFTALKKIGRQLFIKNNDKLSELLQLPFKNEIVRLLRLTKPKSIDVGKWETG